MTAFPKPCLVCGRKTSGGPRCEIHAAPGAAAGRAPRSCVVCGVRSAGNYCAEHLDHDPSTPQGRARRQWWRVAYGWSFYQENRRAELRSAGWRCRDCGRQHGSTCDRHREPIVLEVDHVVELSSAPVGDFAALRALCALDNLRARCRCCCHRSKTSAARRARG